MDEPLELLMACHERIHRFLAGAEALAAFDDWSDPRALTTARDCARYFREALPLHAADEDESLAPRLRRLEPGLAGPLAQMAGEHDAIHEARSALVDALQAVVEGAPRCGDLDDALDVFAPLIRGHLELEEGVVFVHLERLPLAERREITAEMRARRTQA